MLSISDKEHSLKRWGKERFTSLPIYRLLRALQKKGVDVSISHDAGSIGLQQYF